MSTAEISAKNLGPIQNFSFKLDDYGITVISGENGYGKSTLLEGVQRLASGETKYPLRDGERRGELSAFGAKVTISGRSRLDGQFGVTSIQGRLDLATLVDPGIKNTEAADKARIRALVNLTGVKPDLHLFADREEFIDFAELVDETLAADDLTELAARIKRIYEKEARVREDSAERAAGQAEGYRAQVVGIDIDEEADLEAARQAHTAAVAEQSRIDQLAKSNAEWREKQGKARQKLNEITEQWTGPTLEDAQEQTSVKAKSLTTCQEKVHELRKQLEQAELELSQELTSYNTAKTVLRNTEDHFGMVGQLQNLIDSDDIATVSQEAIEQATQAVTDADAEYNRVRTLIDAKELAKKAAEQEATAVQHRESAAKLRTAAHATEDVLADAIQCDAVRIEIEDGVISLVTDHPVRGKSIPFRELSVGERWKIAIDLAVRQVGEGGLLVIPQEAFEGLSDTNARIVSQYAKERKVYILTAKPAGEGESPELKAMTL